MDRGWLDGYAKGGAWMCNNNPRRANSAAASHSARSTGSNATTAYYASSFLQRNVSPFRFHPLTLGLSFSLCFSPVSLHPSLVRPPSPSTVVLRDRSSLALYAHSLPSLRSTLIPLARDSHTLLCHLHVYTRYERVTAWIETRSRDRSSNCNASRNLLCQVLFSLFLVTCIDCR